jgi:hypothetical protein
MKKGPQEITFRDFAETQTSRLEAMGIVFRGNQSNGVMTLVGSKGPLHPHPSPGRKRLYKTNRERWRASYHRKKSLTPQNRFETA